MYWVWLEISCIIAASHYHTYTALHLGAEEVSHNQNSMHSPPHGAGSHHIHLASMMYKFIHSLCRDMLTQRVEVYRLCGHCTFSMVYFRKIIVNVCNLL